MANNKLQLEVDLKTKLQESKSIKESLGKSGGFKDNPQAEKRLNAIIQELESLTKISNPTIKNLNSMNALFNEMSGILLKIAHATNTASEDFKKLEKELKETESMLEKAQKARGSILKQGRINKDKNKYELYDTYQKEVISQANIRLKNGRQIKSTEAFFNKFENGVVKEGVFQNKSDAQKVYDSLIKAEADNANKLQELNTAIAEYTNTIQQTKDNLIAQGKKETSPTASKIVQNKIDVNRTIESTKEKIHQVQNESKDTSSVVDYTKAVDSQTSSLGKAFKQFTIYNLAIKSVKKALNEAKQTVQELDKYLTEQAMVTGLTRKETYELVGSYQQLALQCGATTKEIAQVSTEYMKQGKTIQESLILTEAAVKAAKVARVSVGDSVNYLTTALNGFRLSAEDAMKVSDKFAAVAASSATDYDELAIALSKVASQANLAGMSIDYTTALLTKGLETTREAPETMGTALKTIIARMRELGDYGETLDDGMDINNVESQLQYIGIALRDQQGELRSTEDVLDELGKKWDTLNKNQQAAIAKALAGTRQQSRLIAMMEDYERVTELQEIAQRSAGATASQAATYLEGMEAAMNKIQVAWEKIVMNLTNSELVINTFNIIANTLDKTGDFLDTIGGQVITFTTLATLGLVIVGHKLREYELARLSNEERLKSQIIEQNQIVEQAKSAALTQQSIVQQKLANKLKAEGLVKSKNDNVEKLKGLKIDLETKKANKTLTIEEQKQLKTINARIAKEEKGLDQARQELKTATDELLVEQIKADTANNRLILEQGIADNLEAQMGWSGSLFGVMTSIQGLLLVMKPLYAGILMIKRLTNAEEMKAYALELRKQQLQAKGFRQKMLGAAAAMAESVSANPFWGWAVAIGILAAVGIGIGVAAIQQSNYNRSAEGTAERINDISNELYKLNEKVTAIDNIANSFDNLSSKIIKTNEDLKEMNSLLEQGSETLSDEVKKREDIGYGKGISEKAYYESFSTNEGRRRALDTIKLNNEIKAEELRQAQIKNIRRMSRKQFKEFFNKTSTNTTIQQAQEAVYALNNNTMYDYVDLLKQQGDLTESAAGAVEELTQQILEQISVEEAWVYVNNASDLEIKALVNTISKLTTTVKNANGKMEKLNIANVLTSDDYSLQDQVNAYKQGLGAINQLGDKAAIAAYEATYNQYEYFATLNSGTLEFIDNVGLSIDEINQLYGAWESLQKAGVKISQEQFEGRFKTYLNELAFTQGDVVEATRTVFGNFLGENEKYLNDFITIYGDLVQVGVLNMGQNMDQIQNKINNFYEKAAEWSSLTNSERSEFIQDNADLFSDSNLLEAFESADYNAIEEALKNNAILQKQIDKRREEIRQELLIEEKRTGEDRNNAYIQQLKEYQKYLDNVENLFKASLEVRLEQEKNQLEEYKNFLQEQQKAEEESLEKRKKAYEDYFDTLNEKESEEEYDEKAELLTSNLVKLASSTDASALAQTKELEKQLADLEEERLKELREKAQEAVLENMDDELEAISEKFDKLLENNQAMLAMMRGDLEDPASYIGKLISNQVSNGATANELQQYLGTLQGVYGSGFKSGDLEDISVREENNQLILNVNGQEVVLDTQNEQNLYAAIMKALTEIGLR